MAKLGKGEFDGLRVSDEELSLRQAVMRAMQQRCEACTEARLCPTERKLSCERSVVEAVRDGKIEYAVEAPFPLAMPRVQRGVVTDTGFKLSEESLERRVKRKARETWKRDAEPATPKPPEPPVLPPAVMTVSMGAEVDRDATEVTIDFRVAGDPKARRAMFTISGMALQVLDVPDLIKCAVESTAKAMLKAMTKEE